MEELCKEDGVISPEFKKLLKTKGSKVYCESCIGWIKISKSEFSPVFNMTYLVELAAN